MQEGRGICFSARAGGQLSGWLLSTLPVSCFPKLGWLRWPALLFLFVSQERSQLRTSWSVNTVCVCVCGVVSLGDLPVARPWGTYIASTITDNCVFGLKGKEKKKINSKTLPLLMVAGERVAVRCLISYKFVSHRAGKKKKGKHSVSCLVLWALCCGATAWWLFSLELRHWFGPELILFEFWPEFPGQSSHNTDALPLCLLPRLSPFSMFTSVMHWGRP